MDHHEQHHQHHQHEREEEKRAHKAYAQQHAQGGLPFHPAWLAVGGLVLVLLAVILWTLVLS